MTLDQNDALEILNMFENPHEQKLIGANQTILHIQSVINGAQECHAYLEIDPLPVLKIMETQVISTKSTQPISEKKHKIQTSTEIHFNRNLKFIFEYFYDFFL